MVPPPPSTTKGALTAPELYDQYVNLRSSFGAPLNGSVPENVTRYLDDQSDWIAQTAAERGREDPFWNMAGLIFAQFQGLQAGYNVVAVEELPLFAFRLLNWWAIRKGEGRGGGVVEVHDPAFCFRIPQRCGDLFDIVPAGVLLCTAYQYYLCLCRFSFDLSPKRRRLQCARICARTLPA